MHKGEETKTLKDALAAMYDRLSGRGLKVVIESRLLIKDGELPEKETDNSLDLARVESGGMVALIATMFGVGEEGYIRLHMLNRDFVKAVIDSVTNSTIECKRKGLGFEEFHEAMKAALKAVEEEFVLKALALLEGEDEAIKAFSEGVPA